MVCNIEDLNGIDALNVLSKQLSEKKIGGSGNVSNKELNFFCQRYKCKEGQLGAFIVKSGNTILGIIPYRKRKKSFPVKVGSTPIYSSCQDVIQILLPNVIECEFYINSLNFLLHYLATMEKGYPIYALEIDQEGHLWRSIQDVGKQYYFVANTTSKTHMFHQFGDTFDAAITSFSKNRKKDLIKAEKKFMDKFGTSALLMEYKAKDHVKHFLAAAEAINRKTYQARLLNETIDSGAEATQAFEASAEAGFLRSFVLWVEDIPIAFVEGYQTPSGVYEAERTGYDPAYSEYRPGVNCHIQLIRRLYQDNKPIILDFGVGDGGLKRLFSNRERQSVSPILLPKNTKGASIFVILEMSRRLNTVFILLLERFGLKNRIKKIFIKVAGAKKG